MAKATAKPCIKKKNGKKSYLVIVAPVGIPFKPTTTVKDVKGDGKDWDIDKQTHSSDDKKITIKISGKARATASKKAKRGSLVPDPEPGTLTITLDDPPAGVEPEVTALPVEYVDDFD